MTKLYIALHTKNPDGTENRGSTPMSYAQSPEEMRAGNLVMPDQRSTTDQLRDLLKIANKRGMYDAADVITKLLDGKP